MGKTERAPISEARPARPNPARQMSGCLIECLTRLDVAVGSYKQRDLFLPFRSYHTLPYIIARHHRIVRIRVNIGQSSPETVINASRRVGSRNTSKMPYRIGASTS